MADLFSQVNQASLQLVGQTLEWLSQQDLVYPNGDPTNNSGVALLNSPRTQVQVGMREEARHRISRLSIRVVDLTDVYRVDINANVVTFDAGAAAVTTAEEIIQGIVNAIQTAGAPVDTIVTAETEKREDPSGLDDTVKIIGIGEADYTVDVPNTAGTAETDLVLDATSATFQIWYAPKPPLGAGIAVPNPAATSMKGTFGTSDWTKPNGANYSSAVDGFVEVFDTAGSDRLYVEILTLVGPADSVGARNTLTLVPRITVGPAREIVT
jgi:hypothetical protein